MGTSINDLIEEFKIKIRRRRENLPQPKVHLQRIVNIRQKLSMLTEEKTPQPALSDMYCCVGRLQFYPGGEMFMYLDVSNKAGNHDQSLWPVRATWKIELIDEYDATRKSHLGDNSFIFNKPKQGFVSSCSDLMSLRLDQLEASQLIGQDGSVTLRWSVIAVPALEYSFLEQVEDILLQIDLDEETYDFELLKQSLRQLTVEISGLQESVKSLSVDVGRSFSRFNERLTKHTSQISSLENEMRNLNNNLHMS